MKAIPISHKVTTANISFTFLGKNVDANAPNPATTECVIISNVVI